MDISGKCRIMKIYISEDSVYNGHNLYHALVLKLKEADIAGVTVYRGIEGYGKGKRINSAKILELSSSLPIIVEAIDREEKIKKALPHIQEMVGEGLILLTDAEVISYGKNI